MKKITFLLSLTSLFIITGHYQTFGFSIPKLPTNTDSYEAAKPLGINSIINLSAKQFSELTGKKMNAWDKLSFRILKIKMKHDLKKNPDLTLKDYSGKDGKKRLGTGWWILIGVAGIFLLAVIIFLIAYGSGGGE
ncbi:MAG: hypothetical protein ABIO05_05760 [Ferruginibacter sp.]